MNLILVICLVAACGVMMIVERLGAPTVESAEPPVVVLQEQGTETPVVFMHGDWTGAGWYVRRLAPAVAPNARFLAMPPTGADGDERMWTIESIATHHIAELRKVQPTGPYRIVGFCVNSLVAFEMACQLRAAGETVERLVIIDANPSNAPLRGVFPLVAWMLPKDDVDARLVAQAKLLTRLRQAHTYVRKVRQVPRGERVQWLARKVALRASWIFRGSPQDVTRKPDPAGLEEPDSPIIRDTQRRAMDAYLPGNFDGTIDLLWAVGPPNEAPRGTPIKNWRMVAKAVNMRVFRSTHLGLVTHNIDMLSKALREVFERDAE